MSPLMNSNKTWCVHIPKRVAKSIKKLPQSDRKRVMKILHEFEHDPWSGDIVKIKGDENRWRRRIGSYRIFYSLDQGAALVEIMEIERRTSNTY